MQPISHQIMEHATTLARAIGANAVLIHADADVVARAAQGMASQSGCQTILVSRKRDLFPRLSVPGQHWVNVPNVQMTRVGQLKLALLVALTRGVLGRMDRVVCIVGVDGSNLLDTIMVLELEKELELISPTSALAIGGEMDAPVFERVLNLATQLASEGREGRPIGATFVVGDSATVLARSRNLVLNPFRGYTAGERNILDPALEDTIKEFSAIDGAFVIDGDGTIMSAGTYLNNTTDGNALPKGLGTRHASAIAVTAHSRAVAITISQSTGTVRIFKAGRLVTDLPRSTVAPTPYLRAVA